MWIFLVVGVVGCGMGIFCFVGDVVSDLPGDGVSLQSH